MTRLRSPWLWGVSVAVVIVAVVAILVTMNVVQQARDQRFLDALDADDSTTIGDLPDEQLLVSREAYCEDIARGWDIDDAVEAASNNWQEGAGLTKAQYDLNVRALFNAASVAC